MNTSLAGGIGVPHFSFQFRSKGIDENLGFPLGPLSHLPSTLLLQGGLEAHALYVASFDITELGLLPINSRDNVPAPYLVFSDTCPAGWGDWSNSPQPGKGASPASLLLLPWVGLQFFPWCCSECLLSCWTLFLASSAISLRSIKQKENLGVHHCVLPWVSRFLASLPSSFYLSGSSYVYFTHIVLIISITEWGSRKKQVFSIFLEEEISNVKHFKNT